MNRRARRAAARKFNRITFRTIVTPPKLRRGLLLGASGLALAVALSNNNDAAAMDECGPAGGTPPSVTCTAAGNPYPNGIWYDVSDLTIVVDKGVIVDTTGAAGELGGIVSGTRFPLIGTAASGDLVVTVSSGVSITTDDTYADGVAAGISPGSEGSASITTFGTIKTSGDWASGIGSHVYGGDIKVTAGGNITTSGWNADGILISSNLTSDHVLIINSSATITTSGEMASGLRADSEYNTNVDIFIKSSGKITTSGDEAEGIYGSSLHIDSDVTITSSSAIITTGAEGHGIRGVANGPDSAITISSSGKITTTGKGATGLYAETDGVNSDITIANLGTIATAGDEANGVRAITTVADSGILVVSTGKISTSGEYAAGILVGSKEADSDIMVISTAKIATGGDDSHAIFAVAAGTNSDVTITSTGDLVTIGNEAHGILSLTAGTNSKTSIISTGTITTADHEADGIRARAAGTGATISIASTGGISTAGGEADAIEAEGTGNVTINSTGKITTKGAEADGIYAESSAGKVTISSSSAITTAGSVADGIHADAAGNVNITSSGAIKAAGSESYGIWASTSLGFIAIKATGAITTAGLSGDAVHAEGGDIFVTVKNASATGLNADGIDLETGVGTVEMTINGQISGGWGDGQGVRIDALDTSTVTVSNGASISALSDFAVSDGGESLAIINRGAITGSVHLGGGSDSFVNSSSGTWDLRALADTNGDGVRDAESVAIADFGSGIDTVSSSGTLRLASITSAASVDTTGQIADPFGTDSDIALSGVEQGHLLGLEQFINTGTISLQDGTVGDILAITDQNFVGAGGGGIFRSNGGSLRLDVFLDDGSSGKTDMLFLDVATTSGGGATKVFVTNAGGSGGLTTGDGIQIINVDVSSSSDAFTLGAPVVAGAYEYSLEFQNLAASDQNWYLRSSLFKGAAAYPAISNSALTTWRANLGAFQQRLSDLRLNMTAAAVTVPVMPGIADGGSVALDPARFAGSWLSMTESDDVVAQSGVAGFSQETARAQMGFDFALDNVSGRDDWLVLGVFGGQGWSQADFADADSSADFDIAAMGVYASYFQGPYHLDALVKFDWLDGAYSSDAVSGSGDVELPVFGVSLSTGYQFDLTESETGGLSLQPIAALDYAHVGGDTFRDNSGATIELMDMDSLRGRLGARLVQQLLPGEDGTGPLGNVYLQAGVAQEFLGQSEARVTGVIFTQELPQTTFELGAGFDLALPGEGVRFTFDTGADLSEGEDNYRATGGVKFTW
ncbi:autotransporter outer membrane beta-barrel domain-containing protein [Dongia deserti]|uniref:autotransporter outer membrane beta-barrel domain-containing protein n=1 Tax=Dongia deserti TaxID=2268030 RepID=UPI0013C4185E|nr:autotransporter outer membrane beta-barrel domain-containing protein [Dongia deserti]